ncbi:MAG: sigma-70 family RNA polymerase sigma factor [Kiritimatiellae bacterium]|nr:sigma-70 family RNA polymerase sigma factor [Kiritimatiellia bacterium]
MAEEGELLFAYARRGDVESLAALVRRHSVWLQAFLRGMLPAREDADDAFQETWMRVIRAVGSYRGGSVKAYLAAVARSVAVDRLRRERASVSLDAAGGEGAAVADTVAAADPTPCEAFESKATSEDVRRAVQALPDGPRQVLLMRIEGELAFKDIAAELGVPLGTALTWMRTATIRLREMLGGGR